MKVKVKVLILPPNMIEKNKCDVIRSFFCFFFFYIGFILLHCIHPSPVIFTIFIS